jgi:hypothetical protein
MIVWGGNQGKLFGVSIGTSSIYVGIFHQTMFDYQSVMITIFEKGYRTMVALDHGTQRWSKTALCHGR